MNNRHARARLKHVGSFLQRHRQAAGISQAKLAVKLGYSSPQFISNWERGLALPPNKVLRKLIRVLQLHPQDLISAIIAAEIEATMTHKAELQALLFAEPVRARA